MRLLDNIAFWTYLVGVTTLGIAFRRRQRGALDYFVAGRTMRWLPIGLSVMVTAFSAINYVAFPTEVFGYGLYVLVCLPVFVLVAIPVTRVFMPFYHGMRLTTAYEYLERRFDVRVRVLASGLFIVWRVLWIGTALYASAEILASVTGIDYRALVVLAAACTTCYTALGGIRAVMWTDVVQFVVIVGGLIPLVATAWLQLPGDAGGVWHRLMAAGRLRPFVPFDPAFLRWDPAMRISLWSGLLGTLAAFAVRYVADQVVVQRYFTARSLAEARKGFWCNVAGALITLLLLAGLGLILFVYAGEHAAAGVKGLPPVKALGQLMRSMPAGLTGVVAAGILAATMSSMDAGVNSCCAAYMTDFHARFVSPAANQGGRTSFWLTAGLGVCCMAAALYVPRLGTLFAVVNKVINAMGTPLLALILLGMFSRFVTPAGMLAGGLAGAVWSGYVSLGVEHLALHYYALVNLLGTLAACYLASVVSLALGGPRATPAQLAWTWYARRKGGEETPV